MLSLSIARITQFLGLDWERYVQGFETIDELFEWIEGITINGDNVGVKSKGKWRKSVTTIDQCGSLIGVAGKI